MAPVWRSATPLPVTPARSAVRRRMTDDDRAARKREASAMWKRDLPVKDIAAHFGVTATVISQMAVADREAFPLRDVSWVAKQRDAKTAAANPEATLAYRLEKAAALWASGSTQAQIAVHFGISRNTVAGWQARNRHLFVRQQEASAQPTAAEATFAPSNGLPSDIVEAARLWDLGTTTREIAAALGVKTSTVSAWVVKHRASFPARDPSATARAMHARRRAAKGAPVAAAQGGAGEPKAQAQLAVDEPPISVDVEPNSAAEARELDAVALVAAAEPADFGHRDIADANEAGGELPVKADAFSPLRGVEPVALVDVGSAACRWPVYPEGHSRFGVAVHCCGLATGDLKRSYCDTHTRMSRGPGSSAERAAHKLPRLPNGAAVPVFFAAQAGA